MIIIHYNFAEDKYVEIADENVSTCVLFTIINSRKNIRRFLSQW